MSKAGVLYTNQQFKVSNGNEVLSQMCNVNFQFNRQYHFLLLIPSLKIALETGETQRHFIDLVTVLHL